MKELDKIIDTLKDLRTIKRLKVSDETLFEQAVDIFISRSINEAKKQEFKEPTEKQLTMLKKAGFKNLPKTRQEATKIIKNYLDNLKKENI